MDIVVGDVYSKVLNPKEHAKALELIRIVCKARPSGYQYMPKFKAGFWDGYVNLMPTWHTFPTGLLNAVCEALYEVGIPYNIIRPDDARNAILSIKKVHSECLSGVVLRDYQVSAANTLLEARRGIAKMATNSGKTEVMAAMIKVMGLRSVVLVHRKELLHQTAQRFIDRGIKSVGKIGDSIFDPRHVTVAMIQTLDRIILNGEEEKLSWCRANEMLFIDECHHLSSQQAVRAFDTIPGQFRYGLSGTPLKHDLLSDLKLIAATGEVVVDVDNTFLIDSGYSAKPVIYIAEMEDKSKGAWKMEYADAYSKYIINNPVRNATIVKFCKDVSARGAVLILVSMIEHGRILQEMMPDSVFVHGQDSTERRNKVIEDMKKGSGIFIASPIFDEGVDVPAVSSIVLASGGESPVKLLQRIGRGLRSKSNDNRLFVLDFIDDTNKHLLNHSNTRIEVYNAEGFDSKIYKPSTRVG